nr:hypothetical protein CFP56_19449 [Quercus suber]
MRPQPARQSETRPSSALTACHQSMLSLQDAIERTNCSLAWNLAASSLQNKKTRHDYGFTKYRMTDSFQTQDGAYNGGSNELVDLPSLPLASFLSAFTSQVGDAFDTAATTPQNLESTTTPTTKATTSSISIVTTDTTGLSTVSSTLSAASTVAAHTASSVSATTQSSASSGTTLTSFSTGPSTSVTSLSVDSFASQVTPTMVTTQPSMLTSSTPTSNTLTFPLESYKPLTGGSTSTVDRQVAAQASHRRAIIVGLSVMIAVLLIIGIAICFFLRRRRKMREDARDSWDEKGFPEFTHHQSLTPPPLRWGSGATRLQSGSPAPAAQAHTRNVSASVDEDHHIIRMNTHHWHRPFIQGRGEGIRDSIGPGLLRVMNPDPSRPSTPDLFAGKKLKPTIAAILLQQPRSRTPSSLLEHRQSTLPIPDITLQPAVSRKCSASTASTIRYSHSQASSLPVVQQQPLEDPFSSPPDDVPCNWPLPAGPMPEPKRTLLRPFRTGAAQCSGVHNSARSSSTSTSSRLAPGSRYSDPFDLDRRSARSSIAPKGSGTGGAGTWEVYDGT